MKVKYIGNTGSELSVLPNKIYDCIGREKNISKQVDDKIVGVTTSNGIVISGKSNHYIARIIGSVEQKRNGVSVYDVLNVLTNKDSEILLVKTL